MSSVKKYNTNLVIQSTGVSSNITLDAETVRVPGSLTISQNLTVLGSTTAIETTNTTLKDNIIVLNDGETGNGVTLGTSGISVYRGPNVSVYPSVAVRWNESTLKWQLTNDGVSYQNILVGATGTGLTALVDDTAPVLGGNVNVNGYAFYANINANVMFDGNLQILSTITNNATTLYVNPPAGGDTGVYVVNDSAVNEELVTKSRAFGFSILF